LSKKKGKMDEYKMGMGRKSREDRGGEVGIVCERGEKVKIEAR
jgi:hypothetical protein